MLADTLGHRTTESYSSGQSQRSWAPSDIQRNQGANEASRYLLDPSEIMRLPRNRAIVLFNGPVRFPVLAHKVRYYKVLRWKGCWDRWGRSAQVVPFRQKPNDAQKAA